MSTALSVTSLPESVAKLGVDEPQWLTLCNSLFPGAKPENVLMVINYCRARKLDVMKKPCHIVPMRVKVGDSYVWRDVVMPGIYEYRVTANRTNLYMGHTEAVYGPPVDHAGVKAPEWCAMVMYRWHEASREKIPFPVKVFFTEVCKTKGDGKANDRWNTAPIQMLTKCTEAAGLREAFPDELGGVQTAEEMDGGTIDGSQIQVEDAPAPPKPAQRKSAAKKEAPIDAEFVKVTDVGGDLAADLAKSLKEQEAAAKKKPVETPAEKPSAEMPPSHAGKIAKTVFREQGSIVTLDNGFACGTRDEVLYNRAALLKDLYKANPDTAPTVELEVKLARDPKNPPKLIRIIERKEKA